MNNTERIAEIKERCAAALSLVPEITRHALSYSGELIIMRSLQDNQYLLSEVERLTKGIKDTSKECARRYDEIQRLTAEVKWLEDYDDIDCNDCPLMSIEACDNICKNRSSLIAHIKALTAELEQKTRDVVQLAIESVDREKQLAKLEAEVLRWADAEKDGRLMVLPCKVGDTVYWISPLHTGINHGKVSAIKVSSFGFDLEILRDGHVVKREFEKVFLTRAEAESALSAEGVSE